MPHPARLLLDGPLEGGWNMAVDELLLEAAITNNVAAVRCYEWAAPTVSLGHFQKLGVGPVPQFAGLAHVRRLSGGGALLHEHELTYSLALPASHPLTENPREIYLAVHQAIISTQEKRGLSLRLRGIEREGVAGEFLCFSRGDSFDVVIGENKVLGSAQRRRKGAVLQHGSLVYRASRYAPQFPGVSELGGYTHTPTDDAESIAAAILGALDLVATLGELTLSERERASQLAAGYHVQFQQPSSDASP